MVPAGKTPAPQKIDGTPKGAREIESVADTKTDPPVIGKNVAERRKPVPKALLIAIAVVLVLAAAAGGLYFGGVIHV